MNRWISNFSSTLFYEKRLLAHASVANRKLQFPHAIAPPDEDAIIAQVIAPQFPLVFLDVRDEEANAQLKLSNAEAQAVRAVVAGLLCAWH